MSLGNLVDNNPSDITDLRNGTLSTTIVVNVDPSIGLVVEVDSREDGYNSGDTSFVARDEPAFLVYKTPYVDIDDLVIVTSLTSPHGIVSEIARSEYIEQEEIVVFAQNAVQTVGKPIAGTLNPIGLFTPTNISYEILGYGSNDFDVTTDYYNSVRLEPKGSVDADSAVVVARVTSLSEATVYRLTNTPQDINGRSDYTVAIVITGNARSSYDRSNPVGSRHVTSGTDVVRSPVTSLSNSYYGGDV